MTIPETTAWQQLPLILLPSPVMALACGPEGLWAGGAGGVAWQPTGGIWEPRLSGLPLTSVAALSYADGWLLAGGAGGIARSGDGGLTWQLGQSQSTAQVSALVASPRFGQDGTALAATMGDGILRTTNAGRTWESANFGLEDFEVMVLAWKTGEVVLAGTASGLYRSPNAGRAWRAAGGEGEPVAGLAFLPYEVTIAALEETGLLRAMDGGSKWEVHGTLPEGTLTTALLATPASTLLLGTASHGLLRSTNGGKSWNQVAEIVALSLLNVEHSNSLYAGASNGLWISGDDGATWQPELMPPIHDLRRLLMIEGTPLVAGPNSGMVRYHPTIGWKVLTEAPSPLLALHAAPDGSLFAADPAGLARSIDAGQSWQTALSAEAGQIELLTFGANGQGWAGSIIGSRLWHTPDGGSTWEPREIPFGMLRLVALQAAAEMLLAVTYNFQQQVAQPWRSFDGGQTWARGASVKTVWPLVATLAEPPLFSISNALYVQQPDGNWQQLAVGPEGSAVRRIVGNNEILLALTTNGLYRSPDRGHSWLSAADDLPVAQVMDIALAEGLVYALLAGGQVWSRSVRG